MPAVGPELAVRLSAQGVQDVVAAFARVRQEGTKTGVETSGALKALNGQLSSLTGLLPLLSAGVVASGLAHLSLQARENTENIGKLAEKTGGSVGTLSALALSAHDSEVSLEDLSKGMVKLAKTQDAAVKGGKDQKAAFAALGIGIKDLQQLNAADLFAKVAQKLGDMPNGTNKAALALKLFGKSGAELIPMLDALGADGFDKAVEKAKRLGLFLSDDMVNSARAAQDAVHELEDIAAGLATQFNAGFMPGFTAGVETLAQTITGAGVNSVRSFGQSAGENFSYALVVVTEWKNYAVAAFQQVKLAGQSMWEALRATARLAINPTAAGLAEYIVDSDHAAQRIRDQNRYISAKLQSDNDRLESRLFRNIDASRERKPGSYPKGRGALGDGESDEDKKKALNEASKRQQSYVAMVQARADNEIAILKAMDAAEEADDKRKYEAGLLSLDDYYDRRAKRVDEAYDAEYAQLQAKEAAALELPGNTPEQENKRTQEVEKIRAQEYQLSLKRQSDLAALDDERNKARIDSAQKQLADEQKLATMTGDRTTASRLALQQEINDYTLLLQKQGKSADEIERATAAYRAQGEARIAFQQASEQGNSAMGMLGLATQQVQNNQGSGAISQIAATAQLIKLQQQQLPVLKAIGDQMLVNAIASGDDQAVDQALQFNSQLDAMQTKLHNVKSAATEFTDQLTSTGLNGVTDFFTDLTSGAKNFGDALGDLANTFEKMVGRMIAQLFVYYALSSLVGWIAPTSSLATSLAKAGPFGSLTGYDDGGWTGGTRGKVAGVVHGEEMVIKAPYAAQNRTLLEGINAGLSPAAVATRANYATPMPAIDAAPTVVQAPQQIVQVINNTGQQVTQQQARGPNGEDLIQVIVGEVDKRIANNGSTAKVIAKRFGVVPQGRSIG